MRSIPEKTLEHWTSIYLCNRFPNAALWWPAFGEDVLTELPRMAASGAGMTLALELKTTEADNGKHVLEIDTKQLDRYLRPPSGPPLPVYYVFPVPHWSGELTTRPGLTPTTSSGMTAPPTWWRRQAGSEWFGDWLYVMSAQSVAALLPPIRKKPHGSKTLFALKDSHPAGRKPSWTSLFGQKPPTEPLSWKRFWKEVTRGGPHDGIRWRTSSGNSQRGPRRVQVLGSHDDPMWLLRDGDDGPYWRLLNEVLEPVEVRRERPTTDGRSANATTNERVILHLPESRSVGRRRSRR